MSRSILLACAALGALFASGCNETSFFVKGDLPEEGLTNGSVAGRICDPSGRTWLADASSNLARRTTGQSSGFALMDEACATVALASELVERSCSRHRTRSDQCVARNVSSEVGV